MDLLCLLRQRQVEANLRVWSLGIAVRREEDRLQIAYFMRCPPLAARNRPWQIAVGLVHLPQPAMLEHEMLELAACNAAIRSCADAWTYSSTIVACGRGDQWQHSMAVLSRMEEVRLSADLIAMSATISSCAAAAQWQRALRYLVELPQAKLEADAMTYHAVTSALALAQAGLGGTAASEAALRHVAERRAEELVEHLEEVVGEGKLLDAGWLQMGKEEIRKKLAEIFTGYLLEIHQIVQVSDVFNDLSLNALGLGCIVLDGMVPPQLAADAHAELEQMAQDGTLGRGAPNARKRGGALEERAREVQLSSPRLRIVPNLMAATYGPGSHYAAHATEPDDPNAMLSRTLSSRFWDMSYLVSCTAFIDWTAPSVCYLCLAAVQLYMDESNSQTLVCSLTSYFMMMCLAFCLVHVIQSSINASLDLGDVSSLMQGFREVLRGVCDGALVLNRQQCTILDDASSLERLLKSQRKLANTSFLELFLDAESRQRFTAFVERGFSADGAGTVLTDGAGPARAQRVPRGFRVALQGAEGIEASVSRVDRGEFSPSTRFWLHMTAFNSSRVQKPYESELESISEDISGDSEW
eukprot:g13235.t1